ncbi:MAG: HD-like signal output (HDOD) protein/nitrogen-specific signal transduction histidine kinase [Oceanicoccus sp.]
MVTKTAVDQLPSLPQILVQILDAIHTDKADYQGIADIIRHDTGVATRLVAVANSSYYGRASSCETIERALLFLGTEVVKTIAITASIKQFFGHFNQQHREFQQRFWRRSLFTANFAQVLATLTGYKAPDEAYLCGLLADVGQLILLTQHEQAYLDMLEKTDNDDQQLLLAEAELFQQNHCQVGADMVESWQLDGFMSDAVRYHQEPTELVQDAHHLVKILNLANMLSSEGDIDDQALAAANQLFGLNETLTRELRSRINDDINNLANGLGIDISSDQSAQENDLQHQQARQQLGERLSELGELAQLNAVLWQAHTQEGLQEAAQRSLFLTFGIVHSVLFLLDDDSQQLYSKQVETSEPNHQQLDFRIPVKAGRSLISNAFLQAEWQSSTADSNSPLSVVDRQILRYCQSDMLICWPLTNKQNAKVGVLVFACTPQKLIGLEQRASLANNLCGEIASAITSNMQRYQQLEEQGSGADQYQQKISEAVHEASNPLSIIRNYLEMLRIKLGDEHSANEGLNHIKEEIDRVGNILLRLKDPELATDNDGELDINHTIEATAHIFQDSVCTTAQIDLTTKLDKKLGKIPGNSEHLKQILTNLLKNAVEALPPNSHITISSEASVSFSGRDFTSIQVTDDGPGIPEHIKQNLFSPINSTKGDGHSGLGLSIVNKLIEEMGGSIVCRTSSESGTQFQIFLPK